MPLPEQDMRVALRRCAAYEATAVNDAVRCLGNDLAGGWHKLIPAGARVLLKPNLLKPATPEQVVCPHPTVIAAVARACLEAGAACVRIGDSPGIGSAARVAAKSGIAQVARDMGIEVIEFDDTVTIPTPAGFVHRSFTVARAVAEADLIVNIAKFKTHAMMTLTLAVKNLYGVLVGKQKARWHFQCGRDYGHFARLLVELAYTVRPAVSILDAVIGMEGNGPGNGTPRQIGFLAASRDMLSLDRIVADIAGIRHDHLPVLVAACSMGFDTAREHITVLGDCPEDFAFSGLRPAAPMHVEGPTVLRVFAGLLRRFLTTRPVVARERCTGCGMCAQVCPAAAIGNVEPDTAARVDARRCIRCFCCQEICPAGAISAYDAVGVRLLKRFGLE